MTKWLVSLNGALTFSTLALLTFLGRGFLDWRFEYPIQDPTGSWATPGALFYMVLAGVWVWGLIAAARNSRTGLVTCLILALLLDVAMALATYFIFCPPWTGCEGWPDAWPWNWANLISGLLAAITAGLHLRQR